MPLADRIHIARRFQRAVRIDSDVDDSSALEGFVCPESSATALKSMVRQLCEVGQGAFTWTGPYGSGKSSLVVALSALLSGKKKQRDVAVTALGKETSAFILEAMPPKRSGWLTVPVVGRRENPTVVIGDALVAVSNVSRPKRGWDEASLVNALVELASQKVKSNGGVVLFIDEMGKFLEGAAQAGGDIYVFQQLAEAASRSSGRLVIVGILHQAFEEYANRLSREQREEWSKIQGRFVDLPVNVAGEEQLNLIARAIESEDREADIDPLADAIDADIRRQRPAASADLKDVLADCWPLHPIVSCLLGPISRRRFGQNQRSIFGFLNSAEPQGLQDFLRHAPDASLYSPVHLWDYLQFNLEPSILASPDGHRWSLSVEAVQRCEALGGESHHLAVLKSIALIDMFRERSGLVASESVLATCHQGMSKKAFKATLESLQKWSLIIYRKFADDYAVYAGSDFDIESAVETALNEIQGLEFSSLRNLADVQPILAKRHYHRTGALRWFDVDLVPVSELMDVASNYRPARGSIGQFLLAIPTEGESDKLCRKIAREASEIGDQWDIVAGVSPRSWVITDLTRELWALDFVRSTSQELAGDPVARREILARVGDVQGRLEGELQKAFDNADWFHRGEQMQRLFHAELNSLSSDLADARYNESPLIHNELLNRIKPSSNAVAAQNFLLRRMVEKEGEPRLGIDGFPAEGGLFASLLEATGLYGEHDGVLAFREPKSGKSDKSNIAPLWRAATKHLKKNQNRAVPVSEVCEIWRKAPYGVRDGLMPVLAVAFMLSCRQNLAFYRVGIFQGRLRDLDMDYLTKDASDIQLRWMDLSELSRRLLSGMAEVVRDLDTSNTLTDLAPIDVARGLIAIYDGLPQWTKMTMRLSKNALQIRQLFKRANDPNKFLFDDMPELLSDQGDLGSEASVRRIVEAVREGLTELCAAYPTMLQRLRDAMLAELQVPNMQPRTIAELRERAENVKQLTGDLRLEAFVGRLMEFDGSDKRIEDLASLAANKPPENWSDPDIDRAALDLADLSQQFVRAEAFARVKGRSDKRHAMAVVVGVNGRPTPLSGEFDVTDSDKADIEKLITTIEAALEKGDVSKRNIVLAALAELSARYLDSSGSSQPTKKRKQKVAIT